MLAPSSGNRRGVSLISVICILPLITFCFFLIIALLATPVMSRFLYNSTVKNALVDFKAETVIELMGWENPYYNRVLPKDYKPIHFSNLALRTITQINLEDERSLLGNELPGFALFDTTIVAAGDGTNYTNVPNDTVPTIDYVLKQQQQDITDQGTSQSSTSNQSTGTPVTTNTKNAEIFIYSTHTWENYLPLLGKTGDPNANDAVGPGTSTQGVHLVDTWLKDDLTQEGIPTDVNYQNAATVLNAKGWNTAQAYEASRPLPENAIKSGKPYKLFIDIHRDSARKNVTTVQINNKSYARVDFVIGTGDPHYLENEAIAQKLHDMLQKEYPGLSRGIFEKPKDAGNNGVYNQDLSPHVLLFEIGGVDNNETELKNTDQALAKILSEYLKSGN